MNTTKEQRKEQAVKLMEQLDIYKPYINGFKQSDKVCFFENFGGFWVNQEPEIEKKMKEIEKEYDCTVYAITHEYTDIGEFYDFLIVSNYKEEWGRVSIRSKGTPINGIAAKWEGGGHAQASGAKINNLNLLPEFIDDLDKLFR